MTKLTRKTKLIIEYGRFVDLLKDVQDNYARNPTALVVGGIASGIK